MRGASLVRRLILLLALMLSSVPAMAQSETIYLVVGRQQILNVRAGVRKIAIGDDGIADVKALGTTQVLITGVSAGNTSLIVWTEAGRRLSYTIKVSKMDAAAIQREVEDLLGDREGIKVRIVGDRVIVDGHAFTTEDYQRVEEIAKLYPQVQNFVRLSPQAKRLVADQLNILLQKAGLKNVTATVVGTRIFLEGSVESKEDLTKATLITEAIGEKVENLVTVGIRRMVLMQVEFVEIKRSGTHAIGVKWPLDFTGEASAGMTWQIPGPRDATGMREQQVFTVDVNGRTDFSFAAMFSDGYARVLAQPKLVCASGEAAEFHAGGEIPIPLITRDEIRIEWKKFGIELEIEPVADRYGNISTMIEAEVSNIDLSLSVMGYPGFVTSRVKTNVTVAHGETIVLSGLFNNDEQKDVSKVPLLGHIPILGELFKSRRFRQKKSELVIFVTPRIVHPQTAWILKTVKDVQDLYRAAASQVHFGIFD